MSLVVGDIIQVLHSADGGTTESHIARTRGSMAFSPNVNEAESDDHGSKQMQKGVTSEAWELEFEKLLVSEPGPLQTIGLLGADGAMRGSYRVEKESDEQLRIAVFEDSDAVTAGTPKADYQLDYYILKLSDENLEGDDFGSQTFNISVLDRPIRLDAQGDGGAA